MHAHVHRSISLIKIINMKSKSINLREPLEGAQEKPWSVFLKRAEKEANQGKFLVQGVEPGSKMPSIMLANYAYLIHEILVLKKECSVDEKNIRAFVLAAYSSVVTVLKGYVPKQLIADFTPVDSREIVNMRMYEPTTSHNKHVYH